MAPKITVIGAGVSGLTSALVLARSGKYEITVVAEHMPGDSHINYASPVAGANYLPVSTPGTPNHKYEMATWPVLQQMAAEQPEAGIHFQDCYEYGRAKDAGTATGAWMNELVKEDPWFKQLMPNWRLLRADELPAGVDGGSVFTSVCINSALYLPWLATQCLKHGVEIRRQTLTHINEAPAADLIVNCTGLGSLTLGGVEDSTVYPARGQIAIVANAPGYMLGTSGADESPEELTYVMQRAAGGGTVLGGCFQPGNWDEEVDLELAERILRRSVELCPKLIEKGELQLIRHVVGLRPMRKNGIRVEKEILSTAPGQSILVVHNYGHGGYGYQTSWGAAQEVEQLVDLAFAD